MVEVFHMKIRSSVNLKRLEDFNYQYQHNLIYPTYKKVVRINKKTRAVIEVLVDDRTIFINKSKRITKPQMKWIHDLERANLLRE